MDWRVSRIKDGEGLEVAKVACFHRSDVLEEEEEEARDGNMLSL